MATNNAINVATGATGTVLAGQSVGTAPVFTDTPALTSITLSGGTALSTYSEGTFSPTIINTGTAPTVTYTIQVGRYIKVGNVVNVLITIQTNTYTAGTGSLQVGNLPFPSANDTNQLAALACLYDGITTQTGTLWSTGQIQANSSVIRLNESRSGAGAQQATAASMHAGDGIRISGWYSTV